MSLLRSTMIDFLGATSLSNPNLGGEALRDEDRGRCFEKVATTLCARPSPSPSPSFIATNHARGSLARKGTSGARSPFSQKRGLAQWSPESDRVSTTPVLKFPPMRGALVFKSVWDAADMVRHGVLCSERGKREKRG